MGQRHNRRRTRPRSRRRMNNSTPPRLQQAVPPQPEIYTVHTPVHTLPPAIARNHCHDRVPSAQLWHNRYMAWHGRSSSSGSSISQQRQEASAKLEAEQCRLFGGEPGDDVALCYRMLEFFGGLDFIE
ncbi:hypothetical protein FQN49_004065 [Arthroderma sp. PD_2]|nr:hypothetical protein FQN49_004065 [Arthroderma sp. PD_2]